MNPDYKEIGKNIRLMRIRHGISQSELAQRLDVSQTHMSNLEHGRVSVSLRVLLRLAHFFKCSVDTLLGSLFYDNYLHCSHSLMTANNSSR